MRRFLLCVFAFAALAFAAIQFMPKTTSNSQSRLAHELTSGLTPIVVSPSQLRKVTRSPATAKLNPSIDLSIDEQVENAAINEKVDRSMRFGEKLSQLWAKKREQLFYDIGLTPEQSSVIAQLRNQYSDDFQFLVSKYGSSSPSPEDLTILRQKIDEAAENYDQSVRMLVGRENFEYLEHQQELFNKRIREQSRYSLTFNHSW